MATGFAVVVRGDGVGGGGVGAERSLACFFPLVNDRITATRIANRTAPIIATGA
jgi:hypothetical protein